MMAVCIVIRHLTILKFYKNSCKNCFRKKFYHFSPETSFCTSASWSKPQSDNSDFSLLNLLPLNLSFNIKNFNIFFCSLIYTFRRINEIRETEKDNNNIIKLQPIIFTCT